MANERSALGELIVDLQKISNRNYSPQIKVGLAITLILISSFIGSAITKFLMNQKLAQPIQPTINSQQEENIYYDYEYRVLRR